MAEIKRVTLHPLKPSGEIDTDINLYPKTLSDGIVDRNGNEVPFPDDNNLVHKTDNEEVGGNKTFTGKVIAANLESKNEIKLDQSDLYRTARFRFKNQDNHDQL